MRLRVGCSGWSYPEWVGPFYPPGTPPSKFLSLYARAFDTLEVDSTFYGVPDAATVDRWSEATPEGFTFCPKVPQEVTGGVRGGRAGAKADAQGPTATPAEVLDEFMAAVSRLDEKLGPLVFQFPPSYERRGHEREVAALLGRVAGRRAAFEFRHRSWFEAGALEALRDGGAALVWSQVRDLEVPPEVTANFAVMRFIGDRSLEPQGRVEEPHDDAIGKWAGRIETRALHVEETFVFFNNHFEGFGPGSANRFLARLGQPVVDWTKALAGPGKAQTRLGEF